MFTLESPSADARVRVGSREELAVALGCSVRKIASMLKLPGNPGRAANGAYPLAEWREFEKKHVGADAGTDDDADGGNGYRRELAEAVLREKRAKAERAELEAAKTRGELVAAADAVQAAEKFATSVRETHKRLATVELVNLLASRLALDAAGFAELRRSMEKFHEDFCVAAVRRFEELAGNKV